VGRKQWAAITATVHPPSGASVYSTPSSQTGRSRSRSSRNTVGNVGRPSRNKVLMRFIRDPVDRGECKTDQRLPQRDARRQTASEGTRDHHAEPEVPKCVRGLVGDAGRKRWLMKRGHEEDYGHVNGHGDPETQDRSVIQSSKCKMQTVRGSEHRGECRNDVHLVVRCIPCLHFESCISHFTRSISSR